MTIQTPRMNGPDLPLILEPAELEQVLKHPQLMIVDLSQAQTHAQLHIPGAIHVSPAELVSGVAPASGKLPSLDRLTALFSRIGYEPRKHIVVYDDEGGGWAGRFIWTLDVIGHKHYSFLNGGLHSWYREGFPVTPEKVAPAPSSVELRIDKQVMADVPMILDKLDTPKVKIWDARARDEYDGSRITAARPGHIPGAVHLNWLDLIDRERNLRLYPESTLREKLQQAGIETDDEIITHCHSHHRSGLSYFVASALGYRVRAYDGSWSEWGNLPDTPVEI